MTPGDGVKGSFLQIFVKEYLEPGKFFVGVHYISRMAGTFYDSVKDISLSHKLF